MRLGQVHASSSVESLGRSWLDVTCLIERLIMSIIAKHRPFSSMSARVPRPTREANTCELSLMLMVFYNDVFDAEDEVGLE